MDISNLGQNDDVFTVLKIFADADVRSELFWKFETEGDIRLFAICSDTFAWATADVEEITTESIPVLRQTLVDLQALGQPEWLSELYAARMRRMRPMRAFYTHTISHQELTKLFDACGPERKD